MAASLLAANPAWLAGTGPAAPVALPVPAATEVDAVTAGTFAPSPPGSPPGTATLVGADGASYRYTGVTGAPPSGTAVAEGAPIGTAPAGGITFGITVPDVAGAVCAGPAMRAWSAGTAVDVHALPSTCPTPMVAAPPAPPAPGVPAPAFPAPSALKLGDPGPELGDPVLAAAGPASPAPAGQPTNVLVVTDKAAGATATDVQGLLSSPQITSNTVTVDGTQTPLAQVAAIMAAEPQPENLIVMNMGSGTPAQAAALLALLPPGQQVLWVAPPTERGVAPAAAAPAVTAAYLAAVAAHPNFRVETVPAALAVVTTGSDVAPTATWPDVGAKVVSSMVSNYAGTAYNLPLGSAQVSTVLAYAEAQLGKPYVWAAAGPSSFDCSGLTMQAFAQVGLNYIHNAYEQYEATKANAVSPANLQPGDLVFFGPNESGIHHVGIYVGNNQFIDAPDTGSVVRFDTLGPGWDFFGATDPLSASPFLAGLFKTAGSVDTTPGSTAGLDLNHTFAKALSDATWDPTQYPYLVLLWNRESGWNPAAKNPSSGAFGIPQALPAAKMASAGPDWATDPLTQIMWGLSYIQGRFGTPAAAWAHETSFGWY